MYYNTGRYCGRRSDVVVLQPEVDLRWGDSVTCWAVGLCALGEL